MATVFLTGRECPWRCAMCDLWRYTTITDTPRGAIAAQIAGARSTLADERVPVTGLKLYNAGSFFDPRAVPEADYDEVAAVARRVVAGGRGIASRAGRRSHRSLARVVGAGTARGRGAGDPRSRDGPGDGPPRCARSLEQTVHARAIRARRPLARGPRRRVARVPAHLAAVRAGGGTGRVAAAFPGRGALLRRRRGVAGADANRQWRGRGIVRGRLVSCARSRRHRAQLCAGADPCGWSRPDLSRPLGHRAFRQLWRLPRRTPRSPPSDESRAARRESYRCPAIVHRAVQ